MTTPITQQFDYGNHTITLETGRIARQATGAVFLTMGEVKILATVVANYTILCCCFIFFLHERDMIL